MPLTREAFEAWLRRYGAAWEARDPDAAGALFAADARYHWTPFQKPKRGPAAIAAAWREATSRQRDVRFSFEVLALDGPTGIARWRTRLARPSGREIELDGVLLAEFDADARCRLFREWWHSSERE
jgi:hypothetical protein